MVKIRLVILSIVALLAIAAVSSGGEAPKVKHVASIYVDAKGGRISLPQGVACTKTTLLVSDTGNNRLLRYSIEGGEVKGGTETKVPELTFPLRIAMNSKGEIFVLDGGKIRIERISPEGTFTGYLDPAGIPGGTMVARSLKIDTADNMYLLDIFGGRVILLDPSGTFAKQIPFPEGYGFISDVAADAQGVIYLLDSVNAMIYSSPKDGQGFTPLTKRLEGQVTFPTDMAIDKNGTIFVTDHNGGVIAMFGQNGAFLGHAAAFGWKEGLLRYPGQLCVDEKGELFVADKANSRIQMFTVIR